MTFRTVAIALFAVAGLVSTAWGQAQPASPATVILKGEAGQSVTLTAADIAAAPRAGVNLIHDGKTLRFEGARLDALLLKVDAPLGKALHGAALGDVVLARASDGYRVALALSDLDPGLRAEPVILADRLDGQPLAKDGPFRLVVGGDQRPARAARGVVEIDVLRLP